MGSLLYYVLHPLGKYSILTLQTNANFCFIGSTLCTVGVIWEKVSSIALTSPPTSATIASEPWPIHQQCESLISSPWTVPTNFILTFRTFWSCKGCNLWRWVPRQSGWECHRNSYLRRRELTPARSPLPSTCVPVCVTRVHTQRTQIVN